MNKKKKTMKKILAPPTRSHVISLRITDEEREVVDRARRKKKMSVSALMREAFLQVLAEASPPTPILAVEKEKKVIRRRSTPVTHTCPHCLATIMKEVA